MKNEEVAICEVTTNDHTKNPNNMPYNMPFKVITPIFSYGADQKTPEIRPASIKGMMRYMWRIAQSLISSDELLKKESELFGDAQKHVSPIRLAIVSKALKGESTSFLFHKNKFNKDAILPQNKQKQVNTFTLRMSLRFKSESSKNMHFYESLLELSFMLMGLGQRSRKGRGRAQIFSNEKLSSDEIKTKILNHLNVIAEERSYELDGKIIKSQFNFKNINRPVIEKVQFGKLRTTKQKNGTWDWKGFLKSVDDALHKIKVLKDSRGNSLKSKVKNDKGWKFATGDASPRFASSIIVGVADTKEGLLPIYTFVKPVVDGKLLDATTEWNRFIELIEGREANHESRK
ncbi:MAG: type III-B CRISPR module RAMP protein Cmr1 [Defluviitaleaceae bacterium]|nr:type III-B CRISPR module RAMP protein Cmr1 [Defluviitaleaceae bacterium]